MTEARRKPLLPNVVALVVMIVLLVVGYVLSYVPVEEYFRSLGPLPPDTLPTDGNTRMPLDGGKLPLYRPVDWLIDHTAVRDPLFWWADLWGVRPEFETLAIRREIYREELGSSYR